MVAAMRSNVVNIDAPFEGWDAYNALDNMPENAAVILDNLIPGPGKVETRKGYVRVYDLGTALPVETIASLNNGGEERIVMASDGGIWDAEGVLDDTSLNNLQPAGTYASSRWQSSTFRRFDENTVLLLTNGVDRTQVYSDNGGTYGLTPIVDTDDVEAGGAFIGSVVYKGRAYYWRADDDAFYYAQAGAYQGELTRFELGTVTKYGGSIMLITTWTQQDSGDGKDDFFVVVFKTGEMLVYQGDNPDAGGYWELIGKFFTSEPLSVRGVEHYGSDVVLMTRDGYINLATVIQQGRTTDVNQFSRRIYDAVVSRTGGGGFERWGWECKLFPRDGLFLFNVPLNSRNTEQHVLNVSTMRWCRFVDMNMVTMELHRDNLWGGGTNGRVYRLLEGASDDGNPIQFACLTAYNTYGNPGYKKHVTAAQILSTHANPETIRLQAYGDYEVPIIQRLQPSDFASNEGIWADPTTNPNPFLPPSVKGSFWADEVDGNKGAFWSSSIRPRTTLGWQNVSAYGYAVALLVQFARINEGVVWRNTGIRYLTGGAQ